MAMEARNIAFASLADNRRCRGGWAYWGCRLPAERCTLMPAERCTRIPTERCTLAALGKIPILEPAWPTAVMTHHEHNHNHGHEHHAKKSRGLHKDWRAWLVVVLMLAAMAMYLLSGDESFQPGQAEPVPRMPAAAGP
jgi:ABC-type nickel/cobalt efflux system permease component RcnA